MEALWQEAKSLESVRDRGRPLTTREDFESAVELQQEIWGFAEIELLPVRLFVVATKIGGQAFGAFDGDRMIGFCLAIPGIKAGGEELPAQPHAGRAARSTATAAWAGR